MTAVDVLIICLAACLTGWALTLAALWRAHRPAPVRRPRQRRRREHQVPAHPPLDRTAPMPVPYSPGRAPIQAGYAGGRRVR